MTDTDRTEPAVVPPPPPVSRPPRRILRAVLRWTAAVLVLGGVAGGTGYGIAQADRTDLPGLATEHDGRWVYPELKLPALPAGAPRPTEERNEAGTHLADLRKLLVPRPEGAEPDKSLEGENGLLPMADFLEEFREEDRDAIEQVLIDDSCRHIAARGWTMPDGTRSRVYLLRFNTRGLAAHAQSAAFSYVGSSPMSNPADAPGSELLGRQWTDDPGPPGVDLSTYAEVKPYGKRHVRHGYILQGDTIGLVVHAKPGKAGAVPFRKAVVLQAQLLS